MAEAQGDYDEIFIYMGGEQQVPDGVRRARIHKSVKIVRARAFQNRQQLISVEFHDGVEIIEKAAFWNCVRLKSIKLLGVKIIKEWAFEYCHCLTDVEFGDKLEAIQQQAFFHCNALKNIRMTTVRTIGDRAFANCSELTDLEFGEALRIEEYAFWNCRKLKRIAVSLKGNMIGDHVFYGCPMLATIDLVGGIHQTVTSFHMDSWRSDMMDEINSINQSLPTTDAGRMKTAAIQQWMETVIRRLDHYKAEHQTLLKEATTLLELALWKANLRDNNGGEGEREGVRTTRGSRKRARKEICVTSGADIVIKNVLPFLQLSE